MPSEFEFDYAALVFLSAIGVLQFVAARGGLNGLLFFRRWPKASAILGVLLVAAAFAWFFSDPRNYPDTTVGLDGNQQARWFAIAGSLAVAATLILSSILNDRWARISQAEGLKTLGEGLDVLRRTTFVRALALLARSTSAKVR